MVALYVWQMQQREAEIFALLRRDTLILLFVRFIKYVTNYSQVVGLFYLFEMWMCGICFDWLL